MSTYLGLGQETRKLTFTDAPSGDGPRGRINAVLKLHNSLLDAL